MALENPWVRPGTLGRDTFSVDLHFLWQYQRNILEIPTEPLEQAESGQRQSYLYNSIENTYSGKYVYQSTK